MSCPSPSRQVVASGRGCGAQSLDAGKWATGAPADARLGTLRAGRPSVASRSPLANVVSRPKIARKVQPECSSPVLRRTKFFVASSAKIAMSSAPPIIVPTSVSGGWSGSGAFGCGAWATIGAAATTGGIGRREGENSGRSRVMDKARSGTAQSGLPASRPAPGLSGFIVPGRFDPEGAISAGAASNAPMAAQADPRIRSPPAASASSTKNKALRDVLVGRFVVKFPTPPFPDLLTRYRLHHSRIGQSWHFHLARPSHPALRNGRFQLLAARHRNRPTTCPAIDRKRLSAPAWPRLPGRWLAALELRAVRRTETACRPRGRKEAAAAPFA
jgi:hypothetical protein